MDRAACFGLASSAGVFGSIADMLLDIYKHSGFRFIVKWVDDFLVIALPSDSWSEADFMKLTGLLGVPWSPEKTRPLATVQRYIGFDWDLAHRTVSLPQEKTDATISLVLAWLAPEARFSRKSTASLHGKLIRASCIFVLIRPFTRSFPHFLKAFTSERAKLKPPPFLLADLEWIRFLLQSLPNSLPLRPSSPVDIGWWGDASTSFGIGIVIQGHWAVWKYAPGFEVGPLKSHDIGWAEAVAVELALRIAFQLHIIRESLHAGTRFLVRSDNKGVVAVVNSGRSFSTNTNKVLKEVLYPFPSSFLII